jgi:hypothetical protein
LLSEPAYLLEQLKSICGVPTHSPLNSPKDDTKAIANLAKQGLFAKIVSEHAEKDVHVAAWTNEIKNKMEKLFPTHDLPDKLLLPECHSVVLEFTEIVAAVMKLGRGKSPGLTGWTRELLSYSLCTPDLTVTNRKKWAEMFSTWINVERMTADERNTFLYSILLPLENKTTLKSRPIIIKDAILKCLWRIGLNRTLINDSMLTGNGSTYMIKGGSSTALVVIQAALDAGEDVVCLDGKNAFNELRRKAMFEYLSSRGKMYYDIFPLMNLCYANASFATAFGASGEALHTVRISAGTSQGCVSGPPALEWAVNAPLRPFHGRFVRIVDDVHIIRDARAITVPVADALATVGLNMLGEKLKIISRAHVPRSGLFDSHKYSICKSPLNILGGVVSPDRRESAMPAYRGLLEKCSKDFRRSARSQLQGKRRHCALRQSSGGLNSPRRQPTLL